LPKNNEGRVTTKIQQT